MNRLLFPAPTREFEAVREEFGDVSILHTRDFLYGMMENREHVISLGRGVRLIATLQAISEPDSKGIRHVICTLNGQSRTVEVRDNSVESNVKEAEKADPSNKGHISAPFAGGVTVTAKVGDKISAGDQVATIEAMKMEASITSPVGGTVERVVFDDVAQVQGGDLLLVLKTD